MTQRSHALLRSRRVDRVRLEPLYGPRGSEAYAALTAGDRSEVREIIAIARRVSGRILELAAGAGRLTVPLLALGRPVVAVDSSATMLAQLRRAVPARLAGRLRTVLADMTTPVEGEAFGLVVLGATSITLLDQQGREALYEAVARSAAPGARFLLSVAEEDARSPQTIPDEPDGAVLSSEIRGDRRLVNIVLPADADGAVTVLVSSVTRLDRPALVAELLAHRFEIVGVTPVRLGGGRSTGVVLVEAACPTR
ncbi:class I SAM-dependent methyltransferase [Rathayibacter sp. VKM Ac-2878]|nr:class I SAM-dependent methyltransferase [Rathayibacter sp. VKM Ac-2879]MBF4503246.1 class I SAM-dependent methyltransferase [Rathayibacter sp. VKM Ac-2878]